MTTATAAARVSIVRREMVLAAVLAAFLAGWTASAAHAQTPDWIPPPPPPARVEAPPPPLPFGEWVWRSGHWTFEGREYIWVPGEYVRRPIRGEHWIAGYWAQDAHSAWVWIPGHWQP